MTADAKTIEELPIGTIIIVNGRRGKIHKHIETAFENLVDVIGLDYHVNEFNQLVRDRGGQIPFGSLVKTEEDEV